MLNLLISDAGGVNCVANHAVVIYAAHIQLVALAFVVFVLQFLLRILRLQI